MLGQLNVGGLAPLTLQAIDYVGTQLQVVRNRRAEASHRLIKTTPRFLIDEEFLNSQDQPSS
jgi:hypothetical protein